LPLRSTFKPLIADPRWPQFSIAYQYYIDYDLFQDIGAVSAGETFALVRYDLDDGGSVEGAVHGGIFAIFNPGSPSEDLVNADYFGGPPITYAKGNFSTMFRIFHQSSHLGDEFLLDTPIQRVNLSYEEANLLASYDLTQDLRLYGG